MQVTYLEAFTRIRSFDPNRAEAFPSWLRQMAENNLRDAIRALEARKHPSPRNQLEAHATTDSAMALFDTLSSGSGTPSRAARRNEARRLLAEAIRCLPADYARAVQLYDLESRPVEEVAAALGRSVGAVYMLRMRAHDRLRDLLGEASRVLESRA
jgi:RNA polymerase sigma-70 factor (ECF subfamily)